MLLVAQRLNRIEVGRFPRGIDAEDKSYRGRGDEGRISTSYIDIVARKRWKRNRNDRSDERAQRQPDHSANGREHDSFEGKLHEDVALSGRP